MPLSGVCVVGGLCKTPRSKRIIVRSPRWVVVIRGPKAVWRGRCVQTTQAHGRAPWRQCPVELWRSATSAASESTSTMAPPCITRLVGPPLVLLPSKSGELMYGSHFSLLSHCLFSTHSLLTRWGRGWLVRQSSSWVGFTLVRQYSTSPLFLFPRVIYDTCTL